MSETQKVSLLLVAILLLAITTPLAFTQSTTITVPDDFSTIQEAVNAASPGDTIYVKTGTYHETVTINKNNLALTGENKFSTIIDGGGGTDRTFLVNKADNVQISGFTIQNSYDGIYLLESSFSTVSGNIITTCSFRGIILSCSSFITVSGNTLTSNNDGIELYKSSFVSVSGNTITNSRFGIGTSQSFNNTFSGNTITTCQQGIYMWDCSYTTVSGNTISNTTEHGISLVVSAYCSFFANTITSSAMRGISIGNSTECVVTGNTIKFTASQGIHTFYSSGHKISDNTLTSNYVGLGFYMVSESNVFGNTIAQSRTGITVTQASNNIFYHNSIADNQYQVVAQNSINTWDNSYPSGGNYWSDYTGTDANSDGIGDTPYIIDESNQDRYPLMEPFSGTPIENDTWVVDDDGPADFTTIQEAINHATNGDTILVKAGTYYESVVVNKQLNLTGIDFPIIDSNGSRSTVMITADGVTLTGFAATNCGFSGEPYGGGIELDGVENCVVKDNIAYQNKGNGISLTNANYNTIENNICRDNQNGIRLWSRSPRTSNNNVIRNNTCYRNLDDGIAFWSYIYGTTTTNNNIITLNNCSSNRNDGIYIGKSLNCIVSENILSQNGKGIFLDGRDMTTKEVLVKKNLILNNDDGIYLWGTGLKTSFIVENVIKGNDLAVYCQSVFGIEFYHNDFIQNGKQIRIDVESGNIWDNGAEGNYWSDYTGTDADGNGIGDSTYVIDENNQDNYPLMTPYGSNIPISYTLVVESVPSGVTFTAENVLCTAPWSKIYNQTTLVTLTMPESYSYEGKTYNWTRWSDGDINRTKTVTVNKNIALTAVFTVEYAPPETVVLSPENKTYTTTDVPLEFTVNTPSYVATYSLDGQENVTIVGNTTLTGLSEGPHSVVVYIEEASGNITASDPIYFTVATVSAGFTIVSPENKTYNTADILLIYIKNETCLVSCFELDGQANYTEPGNTTLFGLSDGVHQLVMFVNYTDSFIGEEVSVVFTVNTTVPDTTPPIISVLSPSNTTYNSNEVPLKFTVNEQTDWIGYSLDGQENVTITGNTTLTELTDGLHTILVYANDTSGNTAQSDTEYFTVALPILGVTILAPQNTTYNTTDVPFGYLVNETCNNVTYSLDGQTFVDAENVTVLSGLADGTHELTVVANFTGSDFGESATVWFTVDTLPPTIAEVTVLPLTVNGTLEDGANVNATVTDAVSGVNQVVLRYTTDNETWTTTEMTKLEGNTWNGTIPGFEHATNVTYIVIAEDAVGNTITSEELFGQPNQYQVLPEFTLWIILPLVLATTVLVISYRKNHKTQNKKSKR